MISSDGGRIRHDLGMIVDAARAVDFVELCRHCRGLDHDGDHFTSGERVGLVVQHGEEVPQVARVRRDGDVCW